MSSTANRVIKNTSFLYVKMGITMFISLYTTRLILNSLGASDFGIFNIVGGAIAMLGFLNAAMASATQRFMSYSEGEGNKEKQKSIFNVSFILHLGISFVVGITLLIAGYFFFNDILNIPNDRIFAAKAVYGSLIVSTIFTVMTVPYDAAMNAHENMKYYAIVGIFESFLKLAVAFACVYTTFDKLIVYGSLMACIPLITLTIMRVYCHRHYEECVIDPHTYWNKGLMKEMTSFAGWNFFTTATSMITNYGLGIILNIYFGTLLNAAQGIANQLNGQMGILTNNISKAVSPVIVKAAGAKNESKMMEISILTSKIFYIITTLMIIPFLSHGNDILKWWLNDVPSFTNIFLVLIITISIAEVFLNSLSQIISAIGKIKKISIFRSIITILCLPVIAIAFHFHAPPYIMYIILLIKTVINIILSIYFAHIYCNMSIKYYFNNTISRCIIASVTTYALINIYQHLLKIEKIENIIFAITLLAIIALLIMSTIIFSKSEKKKIKSIAFKLLKKIEQSPNE